MQHAAALPEYESEQKCFFTKIYTSNSEHFKTLGNHKIREKQIIKLLRVYKKKKKGLRVRRDFVTATMWSSGD